MKSEATEAPKMEISDGEVEALSQLVGAAQFEVPHPTIVRVIAEATEVLIRRRVREEQFPDAVYIQEPARGEPDRVLVVPLYGDGEEQLSRVQEVTAVLQPFDEEMERVELAARITAAALDIALSKGIAPDLADQFIRVAIDLAKEPSPETKINVVCLERYPEGTEGFCMMCGVSIRDHKTRESGD